MNAVKSSFAVPFDRTFFLLVIGLACFGLVMLASVSGPVGYERFGDSYYFVKHQFLQGFLPGMLMLGVGYLIPYQTWKTYALPMLLISIGLLVLVFIPGVGTDYGTFAHSWVQLGFLSFQPAEVVKLTFLFYLAAWLEKRGDDLKDLHSGLVPFIVILAVLSVLMMAQPDLGTLSVMAAMSLIVYFIAGGAVSHLVGLGLLASTALGIAIKSSPYRAARLTTFLHPELDPQGIGYQINQALLAIGSGGVFGRGYGHSLQKFQYLPEVIGDSLFAVMSEELGFVLTTIFLLTFLFFLLRGLEIAKHAPDAFGKYLATGIMAWVGVQACINIGAMMSILPLTGVPLPFLSYGGTSLIVTLTAMGVVLNISRTHSKL